jgi:MFS family permease
MKNSGKHAISSMTRSIQIGITELLQQIENRKVIYDTILNIGISLLNWQLFGLVLGGLLWGVLADKFGRKETLFSSILVYSLANLANAYVGSVDMYILLRIVAGIGLAGELGVGISLITENIPKEKRTYATTFVSIFGMLGAASGGFVSMYFSWQSCYLIGFFSGIILLLLRVRTHESVLFIKLKNTQIERGSLLKLFSNKKLASKLLLSTLAGASLFVCIGLFILNTPDFGRAFGLHVNIQWALISYYVFGAAPAELVAGVMSKTLRSRKKPMYYFYAFQIFSVIMFCWFIPSTEFGYYFRCALLGFGIGTWTLLITTSAEQFGTNVRGIAATSIPNIARAWSIPFTNVLFKGCLFEPYKLVIPTGKWFAKV